MDTLVRGCQGKEKIYVWVKTQIDIGVDITFDVKVGDALVCKLEVEEVKVVEWVNLKILLCVKMLVRMLVITTTKVNEKNEVEEARNDDGGNVGAQDGGDGGDGREQE
jgi:hypothetical protein